MEWWLCYLAVGAFAGFVAGLFGVGGGLTLVPLLYTIYSWQHFPQDHVMHLALGTAMATVMFTSLSSMRAHHAHGAVRWEIVRSLAPALIVGTLAGARVAGFISSRGLTLVFVVITFYASLQIMLDYKPKPQRKLPNTVGLVVAGLAIGVISSLVSAGGGFLSVPFMLFCNVPIHNAVGTSAALGFPIAVAGTIGYVIAGWQASPIPDGSLGYVYLPGLAGVVAMSIVFAPIGARTAHRLPVSKLKRAFGAFLALLASRMLWSLL